MKRAFWSALFALGLLSGTAAHADVPPGPWGDVTYYNDATIKGPHSIHENGDRIFVPRIEPIGINKTPYPTTIILSVTEPAFRQIAIAGSPTGGRYVTKFPPPTGEKGGVCVFDGGSRYSIESGGLLTFQATAQCKEYRIAYVFNVCKLDESLRCSEAPWWNFRKETYAITQQGVVRSNASLYPWDDPASAAGKLQYVIEAIKNMNEQFKKVEAPNTIHNRVVSCREYHPEMKTYAIHDIVTGCLITSMCGGDNTPNLDSYRDGDPIDWNSPVGVYAKQKLKVSDVSNYSCWLRTP